MNRPDPPAELLVAIQEFWPESEWENAADISYLESGFNAFAILDTTTPDRPCGARLPGPSGDTAEMSVGYFQINCCNFPGWEWQRLYNARHNAGTAHMLWARAAGWSPWYYSAKRLGLI